MSAAISGFPSRTPGRRHRSALRADTIGSSGLRITRSAASRGAAAGVAFQAGAVAHQREISAFAAGFAFVALGLGLRALASGGGAGLRALLAPGEGEGLLLQLLDARGLLLRL